MNSEEKNEFSSEIKQIMKNANKIYVNIRLNKLTDENDKMYTNHDKKCLSLLLAILKENNDACQLLNDFGISYQKIVQSLSLKINDEKEDLECKKEFEELILLLADDDSRYYTREMNPMNLTSKLLYPINCGSTFFKDLCSKLDLGSYNEIMDSKMGIILEKKLDLEEKNHFIKLEETEKKKAKPYLNHNKTIKNNSFLEAMGITNNIDLSYGRDDEIRKLMVSLLIPNKSAILIGEAGVGKTALVQGIAHRILTENVPKAFLDKKIFSLNVAALVSGCKYVGMFEEKLMKLLDILSKDNDTILFIDEIHSIVGAGKGSNSSNDMANILKPYLDSGKITVIGATTTEEYETYIKPNTGLKRRFEVIKVNEPDNETLKNICINVIDKLCLEMDMDFLNDIYVEDKVIENLVKLTDKRHRHYQDKVNNPDLIVSLLTRSFALAKLYDKNIVEISDIIEAVSDNERIYEISKEKIINSLRGLNASNRVALKEHKSAKIIEFPSKH